MFKPVILFCCALLVVTGCGTGSSQRRTGKPLPPDWSNGQDVPPLMPGGPELNVPQPSPVEPPTQNGRNFNAGRFNGQTWISAHRWAKENGLPEPRLVARVPTPSYALNTASGEFVFQSGSLKATWNGMDVRLGFAPQIVGGELLLHALDLSKTIETLMRGLAITANTNRLIVIDPGHGGSNPGTRSAVDGRHEKEFTLDWALRLAPLLEQRGWRVLLTRTNDMDVSLADRVLVAEQSRADFFLSLHFNATGDGSHGPAGLESYLITPVGMPSTVTRGFPDEIHVPLAGNASEETSLAYAARLHRALLGVNGNNDRGIRHVRYMAVLRGQRCPAVLVEGGYLSNPQEAQLISLPAYRQRLAEAVAKALE